MIVLQRIETQYSFDACKEDTIVYTIGLRKEKEDLTGNSYVIVATIQIEQSLH